MPSSHRTVVLSTFLPSTTSPVYHLLSPDQKIRRRSPTSGSGLAADTYALCVCHLDTADTCDNAVNFQQRIALVGVAGPSSLVDSATCTLGLEPCLLVLDTPSAPSLYLHCSAGTKFKRKGEVWAL